MSAAGREEFNAAVEALVLGESHPARRDKRARTLQAPGGYSEPSGRIRILKHSFGESSMGASTSFCLTAGLMMAGVIQPIFSFDHAQKC